MKIGIYGGSFNPPHLGHMAAAESAAKYLGLDELLLIPAGIPPHKMLSADAAGADDRLAMTRLMGEQIALDTGVKVTVSDMEIARGGKSYTVDTLRQMHGYYEKLLRKYPDVVTVKDVVTLTGYTLTTVHNWCSRGSLKAFQKGLKFCIPKIFLVDFFCSLTFRSITRKSLWHIQTLNEFSRKMKK